jgi:cation/acetate symporter
MEDALSLTKMIQLGFGRICPKSNFCWVKFYGMATCFGISPEGIGTVGMILNFIVTLVVSRLTPPPPLEVQEMVEELRSPAGELPAEAVH